MWGRNVMMGYLNREDKTTEDIDQVSISQTFYEQLFHTKCFSQLFSNHILALLFFDKRKSARKILVKLTTGGMVSQRRPWITR